MRIQAGGTDLDFRALRSLPPDSRPRAETKGTAVVSTVVPKRHRLGVICAPHLPDSLVRALRTLYS